MYSMLSTPLICCSMGAATDCSMVCASAPKYVALTCTTGGTISGYCATGNVTRQMPPSNTVRMAMTIATIGRSMKKLDMAATSPRRLRIRLGRDG